MTELPTPFDFEKYGDLNPEKIAAYFGKTARLVQYEVHQDLESNEEIGRYPVWEIDIFEPTTLASIALFITPDLKEVSAVSQKPMGIITELMSGRNPTIYSNGSLHGSFPENVAVIEGVTRLEVQATDSNVYVKFIAEHGDFHASLDVSSNGKFYSSSHSLQDVTHAVRIEEIR